MNRNLHQNIKSKKAKFLFGWLLRGVFFTYFIYSFFIVSVFQASENLQFYYFEVITSRTSQVVPLKYIFIGDSLTKEGRNWGLRIEGNPLVAKNLAVEGHTTEQITNQVDAALQYSPDYIFVMAGTNDAISKKISVEEALASYKVLLKKLEQCTCIPILTLVPFQRQQGNSAKIENLNAGIIELAASREIQIINLNSKIALLGELQPKFTTDNIHLSEDAYQVWAEEIRRVLKNDV